MKFKSLRVFRYTTIKNPDNLQTCVQTMKMDLHVQTQRKPKTFDLPLA